MTSPIPTAGALSSAVSPRSVPPTAQEIQRKLGSPTPVSIPTLSISPSKEAGAAFELERKKSLSARSQAPRAVSPGRSSGTDSDDLPASPTRQNLPLSAISEASDAGSDSDASSVGGSQNRPTSVHRSVERLRLSRENTRVSENVAVKSGYLMKKGERRKAWKKRWFVLRGGQVAMYKSDKEYRLLRLIPLSEIHTCAPVELKKHSFCFGIVTPSRTTYVKATSNAEVQSWCDAVDRAKEEVRALATVSSAETPGEATPQPSERTMSSAAIPIPSSSNSVGLGVGISESYTTVATSPSPPTPFSSTTGNSIQSSSFTSTSTAPHAAASGPRVPPNSFAQGGAGALGLQHFDGNPLALDSVDAGLERIGEIQYRQDRGGQFSGESSGEERPSNPGPSGTLGGLAPIQTGYFGARPTTATSSSGIPSSPGGIISSSEDEDGFDTFDTAIPVRPFKALAFADADLGGRAIGARTASNPGGPTGEVKEEIRPILSGYLMKQGKRRNWRKRWFVLTSGSLFYSRSHMDSKIHRQIPLTSILDAIEYSSLPTVAPRRPLSASGPLSPSTHSANMDDLPPGMNRDKKNYEHCFKIITPKRTYLVCAPSEEDEIRWLAALQCLVARKVTSPAGNVTSGGANVLSFKGGSVAGSSITGGPSVPSPLASPSIPQEAQPVVHGRQRSITDAARSAVREVEKRFHASET